MIRRFFQIMAIALLAVLTLVAMPTSANAVQQYSQVDQRPKQTSQYSQTDQRPKQTSQGQQSAQYKQNQKPTQDQHAQEDRSAQDKSVNSSPKS